MLYSRDLPSASPCRPPAHLVPVTPVVGAAPAVQTGVLVEGTELEGLHREVLVRAVKLLEQQGKAKLFKEAAGDDEGVKFFTAA